MDMMNYINIQVTAILTLFSISTYSQVYNNDAGAREKAFIYRVQQIDEFMARFNNDENSFIRSVYKKQNVPYKVDRYKSIKSLFNFKGNWSEEDINQFIKSAENSKHPIYLSFTDQDWYADVTCQFSTSNGNVAIDIRLKISTNSVGSKWTIIGVKNYITTIYNTQLPAFTNNPHKYLTPTSHNNDFISLSHAFDDKVDMNCYFERSFFNDKTQLSFYNAVLSKKINFLYVSNIKYYFLQVPAYVFTVENYIRDSLNSGWLISKVEKVNETTKAQIRNILIPTN
jgi:hypothetical protein